ncbi:MAG: ABC transporter substrate-binding protein [Chloroflexi bacterium]|nr:ABC transporter substrate-binding protein [Chloroflexota bacterium]
MRQGLRFGWLIFVAMVVGSIVLASCAGGAPSPATSATPEAKKSYGSIKIDFDFRGGGLDPTVGAASDATQLGSSVFDQLIGADEKGGLVPGIAERWEISPDGKTHTFYVRKGVKFHNGDDLTGADVKFTFDKYMKPESATVQGASWRNAVASVDLKDPYTVVMQMKVPQFELLPALERWGAIVPKKYMEEKGADYFAKNPIGSGPFKLVRYEQGIRIELEAVEGHWRVMPPFKNITLLSVPSEATKIAMLKTGELDIASITFDSIDGVKSAGLHTKSWDGGQRTFMLLFYDLDNPQKYAFGDVRNRKALMLGLNRKEIVDQLFKGQGYPVVAHAVDPNGPYFDSSVLKVDPYDPDQAKRLMAEAGYPNGFEVRIFDLLNRPAVLHQINEAMAGYWRKIGVKAEVAPIESSAALAMISPKHKPEVWQSIYSTLVGTERGFQAMPRTYHSTQSFAKNLRNPTLDGLIEKVPTTADPAERKKLAVEAARLGQQEYNASGVVNLYTVLALGSQVGDLKPYWDILMDKSFETITHAK